MNLTKDGLISLDQMLIMARGLDGTGEIKEIADHQHAIWSVGPKEGREGPGHVHVTKTLKSPHEPGGGVGQVALRMPVGELGVRQHEQPLERPGSGGGRGA